MHSTDRRINNFRLTSAPLSLSGITGVRTTTGTVYTGTPTRVLITAATRTDAQKAADITSAKKFAAPGTSPKMRIKMLADSLYAGVYIQTRLGYIKPIYALTQADLTGSDGIYIDKGFVAQSINDGSKLQPEAAPLDISGNVVVLVEEPTNPLPTLWKSASGKPFTKAAMTAAPAIQALLPDENKSYLLLVIPKSLPILFGGTDCHRGALDEVSGDVLDQNLPGADLWSRWAKLWSKPLHDAVVEAFTTQSDTLGDHFPTIKKFKGLFALSALTTTETLYIDDPEHVPAIDSLKKRLLEIIPLIAEPPATVNCPPAPAASIAASRSPGFSTRTPEWPKLFASSTKSGSAST